MKRLITICAVVVMLLIASADVKATVLLLHFDGEDGAKTTVDSSPSGHTPIDFFGDAQLDTAEKKWGSASLLLDGSGDYLTIADSPDWDILASNTDDWTIDFWVRQDSFGYQYYLSHYQGAGSRWGVGYDGGLVFYSSRVDLPATPDGVISDNNWHHIAFCKVADEYAMYKDGEQVNYATNSTTGDFTSTLEIGAYGTSYSFDGHMDELRIANSNAYDASPQSDCSDTIEVPTGPIPEPATICLLGLGCLALIRRKRCA